VAEDQVGSGIDAGMGRDDLIILRFLRDRPARSERPVRQNAISLKPD
jgi:hypothetical protein